MFGHRSVFCCTGHNLTVHIPASRSLRWPQLSPHWSSGAQNAPSGSEEQQVTVRGRPRIHFLQQGLPTQMLRLVEMAEHGCSLVNWWPPSVPPPQHPDITILKGHPESWLGTGHSQWILTQEAGSGEKVSRSLIGLGLTTHLLIGCLGSREWKLVTREVKSNNRWRWDRRVSNLISEDISTLKGESCRIKASRGRFPINWSIWCWKLFKQNHKRCNRVLQCIYWVCRSQPPI